MNCPYCGARATHNGDAYHCGTRVDGEQTKACKRDSGDVVPFRYMPSNAGVTGNYEKQEVAQLFNEVLECKGRVTNKLRARIKKFLGDE